MSVTVTIDEPKNEVEDNFCIPVCTEAIYKNAILPFAEKSSLSLFIGWGTMVEVNNQKFPDFVKQLTILKSEVTQSNQLNFDIKNHIVERLDNLEIKMISMLEQRDSVVFLIG
jgi:hypothetical protein